ncbi:glutathionylspermidine synthase family protein, partial [Corallococcus exiguus]|nr:glutathionylspermidine synthase family protein [Corallococcus exiguus]
ALVERFGDLATQLPPPLYFSAVGSSEEDRGTVEYLRDCASQAGLHGQAIAIEDIGLSEDGRFTALDDSVIGTLFKLYPLEDLMAEEFGRALPGSGVQLLEPAWKAVLSNKGILPLLWQRNVGHPNLLEAHFDDGST